MYITENDCRNITIYFTFQFLERGGGASDNRNGLMEKLERFFFRTFLELIKVKPNKVNKKF